MNIDIRKLGLAVFAFTLLSADLAGQAPAGFRTIDRNLDGLIFYYPVVYKQIPLPPTEKIILAKYIREKAPRQLSRLRKIYKGREARIYVFSFKLAAPTTPSGGPVGAEKEKPAPGNRPRSAKEAMEVKNKIFSLEDFKRIRLRGIKFAPVKKTPGHLKLIVPRKGMESEKDFCGYMAVRELSGRMVGVYGFTMKPHFKTLCRTIRKMVKGIAPARKVKMDRAEKKLGRAFRGKVFRAMEKRQALRRSLAKGWKAVDTPNFIILHNTRNTRLISKIARDVEAMRQVYEKQYMTTKPIEAVSVVRICSTKSEYQHYGGPPGSGGYWHSGTEELVFFDYSLTMRKMDRKEKRRLKRKLSNKDSMRVLYHESFHQYIYFALNECNPHDWFNEGTAEYFSGAVIPPMSKRVIRIDKAAWRKDLAVKQCKTGVGFVPLANLIKAERVEFYNPRRISAYYAAGWSFVYFLRRSKAAEKNERWSRILPDYFAELQKASLELKKRDLPFSSKRGLQVGLRKNVIEKVMKGIDLDELEEAWKKFTARL